MKRARAPFGDLLREWRERRRVSQLVLASDANISTKHLSFLETGRSAPSREMVLRLSRVLDVPLRERNGLLFAAGFTPAFMERSLVALGPARKAVDLVLKGHEPYPALALDRYSNLVAANDAVLPLLAGADEDLLRPPVNVLRLSLHPRGLAPRIRNLAAWRGHLLERVRHQIDVTADPKLRALYEELDAYPAPETEALVESFAGIAVPLEIEVDGAVLSFISTTAVFATSVDVTLSELVLESFFPADASTAELLAVRARTRNQASSTSGLSS